MEITKSLLISELYDKVEMSIRAFNVCRRINIKTLGELNEYVITNGNFLKVKNCGRRTNIELLDIDKRLRDSIQNSHIKELEFFEFNSISEASFQLYYKVEFDRLTIRSQNALLLLFNDEIPNREMVKNLFIDKCLDPKKLRNIGVKTAIELQGFIDRIIDLFKETRGDNVSPVGLSILKLKKITGEEISETFYFDLFQKEEFPIIAFTSKYLGAILTIEEVDEFIISNHFKLLESEYTLEEIGDKFGLSRERIRQKRDILLEKCDTILCMLSEYLTYTKYNKLFINSPIISIPEDLQIDDTEIEEVGILFSTYLLGQIIPDSYSLCLLDRINKPSIVRRYENYKQFKNIRGSYLIRNTIPKEKLIELYEYLLEKICSKLSNDFYVDIRSFFNEDLSPEQFEIILKFVKEEFELDIHDFMICVPRNTKKQTFEFTIEALNQIGRPAHISEIFSTIKNNHPEFSSSDRSVQSTIGRHKGFFIYFGRTSTYGLKAWENQYKNIKGGTIRDLTEEFLEFYDEPCHISAITAYVNKYRRTDETSVLSNLRMTVNKRFLFFKDGYVGLSTKTYQPRNESQGRYKFESVSLNELMQSIFLK